MIALGNAAGYKLFMNERDSDICFKVEWEGNRWHFPAHGLVLSAMSDVFRVMLQIDMKEKSTREIVIKDSTPLAVKQFLKYLYTGVLDNNNWIETVNVLKIAHKYGVQTLINQCENQLISNLVISNACFLHEIASTYCLSSLKNDTKCFILDTAFIVCSTEGFLNLKAKSLEYFLSNVRFNMENEVTILTSLRNWAVNDCSQKSLQLTRGNVLLSMEPFFQYIRWDFILPECRSFVPSYFIEKYRNRSLIPRRPFRVSPVLQYHVNVLKFVVELGAFCDNKIIASSGFDCLKFGVDNHAFIVGFRIISMFRINSNIAFGNSSLTLMRADNKYTIHFNLNSLPWTKGATVGDFIWRELFAYLPHPIRVDPFHMYTLSIKCASQSSLFNVKWPNTRLEVGLMNSELGPINFYAYGPCYGITQLFMLPAPLQRTVCNDANY